MCSEFTATLSSHRRALLLLSDETVASAQQSNTAKKAIPQKPQVIIGGRMQSPSREDVEKGECPKALANGHSDGGFSWL
jgi:hypothetical protein